MSELKPITREEKILSGVNIQPTTRIEYFLKKASENGGSDGSGLPSYTSADIDKVLSVAANTTETIVVPEQTVTSEDDGSAPLYGVDFSRLTDGQKVLVSNPDSENETEMVYLRNGSDGEGVYISFEDKFYRLIISKTSINIARPNVSMTIKAHATVIDNTYVGWKSVIPTPTEKDAGYVLTAKPELNDETGFIPDQTVTFSNSSATVYNVDLLPTTIKTGSVVRLLMNNGDGFSDETLTYTINELGKKVFENTNKTIVIRYPEGALNWAIYAKNYSGSWTVSASIQLATGNFVPAWSFKQGGAEGTYDIYSNGVYDVSTYAEANVNVQTYTPSGTISITSNGSKNVYQYATANVQVPASAVVSGTTTITENGSTDVTNYATANVQVPASAVVSGTKSITENGTSIDVTNFASVDVNVPVGVFPSGNLEITQNGTGIDVSQYSTVSAKVKCDTVSIIVRAQNFAPSWFYIVSLKDGTTSPLVLGSTNIGQTYKSYYGFKAFRFASDELQPILLLKGTNGITTGQYSISIKNADNETVAFEQYPVGTGGTAAVWVFASTAKNLTVTFDAPA